MTVIFFFTGVRRTDGVIVCGIGYGLVDPGFESRAERVFFFSVLEHSIVPMLRTDEPLLPLYA